MGTNFLPSSSFLTVFSLSGLSLGASGSVVRRAGSEVLRPLFLLPSDSESDEEEEEEEADDEEEEEEEDEEEEEEELLEEEEEGELDDLRLRLLFFLSFSSSLFLFLSFSLFLSFFSFSLLFSSSFFSLFFFSFSSFLFLLSSLRESEFEAEGMGGSFGRGRERGEGEGEGIGEGVGEGGPLLLLLLPLLLLLALDEGLPRLRLPGDLEAERLRSSSVESCRALNERGKLSLCAAASAVSRRARMASTASG